MMTPWGIYMKPRRTGGFTAALLPASAQPMVSKSGSARVAPSPLMQARRLRRNLFVIVREGGWFLDAMIQERITGDDLGNQRLHAVAIAGDGFNEVIHHDLVVALERAAQGIGQQSLGQVPRQLVFSRGDDGFQLLWGSEALFTGELTRGVDRPARIVRITPASDGVEVLQATSNRGEHLVHT